MTHPRAQAQSSSSSSPSVSSAHSPTHRVAADICGWVWKYQSRVKSRCIRRYFRLEACILSNYKSDSSKTAPSWQISLSNCVLYLNGANTNTSNNNNNSSSNPLCITLYTSRRRLRFQLASVKEAQRWACAIRAAATCNFPDFYRLGSVLGAGSFGNVRLATHVKSGVERAVKIVCTPSIEKERLFIKREIQVLLSIAHQNIVSVYDIFEGEHVTYFVMERVTGGDLFDYLAIHPSISELSAKILMYQLFRALAYLHARNIVHRDIKPENILLHSAKHPLRIKLTDFGFANFINPASKHPATDLHSIVGTGCYMPPEIIDARGHGFPVDLFAAGVVLFRLLTARLPFRTPSLKACYYQVMSGINFFKEEDCRKISCNATNLCKALLNANPAKRPSAAEALAHEWFGDDLRFAEERRRMEEGNVVENVQCLTAECATPHKMQSAPNLKRDCQRLGGGDGEM